MLEFHFDHTDFQSLLRDFAKQLGGDLRGDTLYLSPEQGEGYFYACKLPNGLSILISENCFNMDLYLHRKQIDQGLYIFCLEEIFIRKDMVDIINGNKSKRHPPIFAGVYLNSTLFDRVTISSRGNGMRIVRCIFDNQWMQKYLGIRKDDDVLRKYLALRSRNLNFDALDADYRNQLEEIFDTDPQNPMFATILENRIMMLIEIFFTRLFERSQNVAALRFQQDDVVRMMQVERDLVENVTRNPPTVEELARKYHVGVSRLKRQFKQVYGKPVYEYYQKYRMAKAKDLLLSGDFTVKEVGYKFGYQNLSNFANAFKKEYGVLPSELTK
ncbi:MAG: helix-turn-helix transcriptional regulator [Chitinophagaceae bacterium]|nr:helix-turn-helix transcriptional regulator [Chitinophagaceae bacterium]